MNTMKENKEEQVKVNLSHQEMRHFKSACERLGEKHSVIGRKLCLAFTAAMEHKDVRTGVANVEPIELILWQKTPIKMNTIN
jgi:hypothetical protein